MGPVATSSINRDGGYIVSEVTEHPDHQCREHVTLKMDAVDSVYLPGTVLKDDGTGLMVRWDGIGDVAGILFGQRIAETADQRAVASTWGMSYKIPLLVWDAAVTDAQKITAMAQMKAANRMVGVPAH